MIWMLARPLAAIAAITSVAAIATIIVYVATTITQETIREKAREHDLNDVIIKEISRCNNVVKIRDLDNRQELEIHGEGIARGISEGKIIRV